MRAGKRASELWLEILDRAQHRPAPISAFDGFINMGPIVDLRGEPETIRFYETLLAEIDRRIAAGVGAVRDERKRVLWDNLPIWYRIGLAVAPPGAARREHRRVGLHLRLGRAGAHDRSRAADRHRRPASTCTRS